MCKYNPRQASLSSPFACFRKGWRNGGLQSLDVLENIQAAFEGVQAAQVYEGNRVIGVNVMFTKAMRDDLREIGNLPLKKSGWQDDLFA